MDNDLTTLEDLHDDADSGSSNEETTIETTDSPRSAAEEKPKNETENTTTANESVEENSQTSEVESSESSEGEAEKASEEITGDGVEQFLSQYGIAGGIISFEGEKPGETEQKHFNDLSPDEQFNVLSDLAQSGATANSLQPQEQQIIDLAKQNNMSLDQLINELAVERAEQYLALEQSSSVDFKEMSDEAIVARWLKDNNPEASEVELAEELERNKESSFFEKNAASIREKYIDSQIQESQMRDQQAQQEQFQELEDDRSKIVEAVNGVENIMGFPVNDAVKNEVLEDLLEVNEFGDSMFMQKVFSDPEMLFKAAWLVKNAESHFDELESYWKKQAHLKYKEGFNNARNGLPTTPVSGSYKSSAEKNQPRKSTENISTLDDLHDD